ncbi:nad dependent epimerase dehydratase family protein [Lasallia pustulata]|uniref:Nad dependent epimerase dehydratase family protein n=1 Tax=Lasallia pustulata TaxID=136370 RepID=A0A1W5D426_9LECA|nr:nad dependent epimerase dehydratase family protein [Lasallia pustulata]
MLLSRSWSVTSVIRDPSQTEEILSKGKGQPGKVDVLVRSLEDIKSEEQAQSVLDEVKPQYVVWSAGAGGKGGSSRTYAIDRDAAMHFIHASVHTPSITKFLMVSYNCNRRKQPSWWNDDQWAHAQKVNLETLKDYHAAKIDADECLTALAKQRGGGFAAIVLRPGDLTNDVAAGRVGQTAAQGQVRRADVAAVAAELLGNEKANGWYDLLEGDEDISMAVERVVRDKVDCVEGEDVDAMRSKYKL